jgi:hypothetical protein
MALGQILEEFTGGCPAHLTGDRRPVVYQMVRLETSTLTNALPPMSICVDHLARPTSRLHYVPNPLPLVAAVVTALPA